MRALIAALLLATAGPSLAAEIVVTNGDTLQLDRTIYRLEAGRLTAATGRAP